MASTTLSIRVPLETRRWLDRFAKKRGSAGSAATRILEEARRREDFPAVEFRDTPLGRVAYVQGTRVQVAFVYDQVRRDPTRTSEAIAAAFAWPRWKAAGVRAYLEAFPDECRTEWEDLESAGFQVLKRALPQLEQKDSAAP
jgi:predicted transcriptional regulator